MEGAALLGTLGRLGDVQPGDGRMNAAESACTRRLEVLCSESFLLQKSYFTNADIMLIL